MRASSFIALARFLVQQVSETAAWIVSFALDTRDKISESQKNIFRALQSPDGELSTDYSIHKFVQISALEEGIA